jgi:hypothetical protein
LAPRKLSKFSILTPQNLDFEGFVFEGLTVHIGYISH